MKPHIASISRKAISFWICFLLLIFATSPALQVLGVGDSGDGDGGPENSGSLTAKVDPQSGKYLYQVPIVVPPGRQGAQPNLSLSYSSDGANGWCGIGWALEVGFIQRDIAKGVPVKWSGGSPLHEYDDSKGFVAALGGASGRIVMISSIGANPQEYRQETETAFLTYRYYTNNNHWEIIDKNGTTYFFGQTTATRMENTKSGWTPAAGKSTFRWSLDRVVDFNGNQTFLNYTNAGNALYLTNISYNGNVSDGSPCTHNVDFILADRPDSTISFSTGYRVTVAKRLSEIRMRVGNSNVRKYALAYLQSPSTTRSLLKSVTQFGSDFTSALPTTTFTYQVKPFEFEGTNYWTGLNSQGHGTKEWNSINAVDSSSDYYVKVLDIDGDGLPDRVMHNVTSSYPCFYVERNTGSNFVSADPSGKRYLWTTLDSQGQSGDDWAGPVSVSPSSMTAIDMIDLNGDGYLDRVMQNVTNKGWYPVTNDSPPHAVTYYTNLIYTNFYVQFNLGYSSNAMTPASLSSTAIWPGVTNEETGPFDKQWGSLRFKTLVELMDMNGDGLVDRVSRKRYGPFDRFKVQLNTGSGFDRPADWGPLQSQGNTSSDWNSLQRKNNGDSSVILVDINGDGLPDRVMRPIDLPPTNFVVEFNNGAGFEPDENWGPVTGQGADNDDPDWRSPIGGDSYTGGTVWANFLDINGDGLADRVMRVRVGNPFAYYTNAVTHLIYTNYLYTNWVVQINTGSGFGPETSWGPIHSQINTNVDWSSIFYQTGGAETVVDCFDINGDGLPDRVMRHYWSPYDRYVVQLNKGPFPDLMCAVSNGIGGSVQVSYKSSTTLDNRNANWVSDPWAEGTKSLLPQIRWVVSATATFDGFGNGATNTYDYQGGYFNTSKREFRGFHRVTVRNPYGLKTVTYFHQGGGFNGTANGEFQDQEGKQGFPYLVENYDTNGVLLHRTLSKVEIASLNTGVSFPYISQVVRMDYANGGVNYRATAEKIIYDFATGNVRTNFNLGEVQLSDLSTLVTTDLDTSDNIRTETTYKTGTFLTSKPDVIMVSKADLNGVRKQRFNYDTRGNLTSSEVWFAEGNRWIMGSQIEYDAVGNPFRTTDPDGVVTETTFDSDYRIFPIKTTVAPGTSLEMSALASFDPRSGEILRATNHLGLIGKTDYDVFFRPTATYVNEQPNAEPTLWRTRTYYYLNGISGTTSNNKIHSQTYDPGDTVNGIETFTYLDGLGRGIQARVESETNGWYRCSDVYHNDSGKDKFDPLPYFNAGSNYVARVVAQYGTLTEYDSAGRESKTTQAAQATYNSNRQRVGNVTLTGGDTDSPIGSLTVTYGEGANPWVATSTDPQITGKLSKAYADAFGHVIQIDEITNSGAAAISTYYKFAFTGELTNIIDHLANKTELFYDSLGRNTFVHDPDLGYITNVYDDIGRVTDAYDPKGQRIHFNFESVLGRLQSKEVYDSSKTLKRRVLLQYDVPVKSGWSVSRGQLAGITEISLACNCTNSARYWSYDYKDRALKDGLYSSAFGEFVTTNGYNEDGQLVTLSYPNDVARMAYTYQNGVLKKIQSSKGTGSSSETFYELGSINEFGQVVNYKTHSGQVNTTYDFYAISRRLKTISSAKGATTILSKTYKFNNDSEITEIVDNVPGHTGSASGSIQSIQYDGFHRLSKMTDVSGTRSYKYDVLGNMISNGDAQSPQDYVYGSSKPHAVTSANGKTYQYDANGSMTNRNGQTLIYDEEDRLVQVTNATCNVYFGYDYDGTRLWKYNKNGDKYTCYVSSLYEYRENDTAGLCYVYASGQRIAAFRPTADTYALGGDPHPWIATLSHHVRTESDRLSKVISWVFAPTRSGQTNIVLAVAFCLAIILIGKWKIGVPLEKRERRFYFQPLWRRAVLVVLMPALLLETTPVHAQFVPSAEVFYYYHADHLGSSNITTDRSGNVIQHHEYLAYGGERYSENNAAGHPEYNLTHQFTGQVLDDETGLYYYNSRYYDPELGRFIQADTVTPSVADCQSLNRYSYCLNSPLNYTDPSGHFAWMVVLVAALEAGAAGAAIGAVAGGIISAITGGNVGAGILGGAVAGFVTGFGIGAGGQIAVGLHAASPIGASIGGALGGAAGGAASSAIQGGNVAVGAIMGAISGAIAGALDPVTNQPDGTFRDELGNRFALQFDDQGNATYVPYHYVKPDVEFSASASTSSAGGSPPPPSVPASGLSPSQASGLAGFLHGVGIALNVASFIPGPIGAIGSIGSAVFAIARGEYGSAALDLAGVIPGGKIAATALKELKVAKAIKAAALIGKTEKAAANEQRLIKVIKNATGKGNDIRVATQKEAEQLLEKSRPEIPWRNTYEAPKPNIGKEIHPSDGSGVDLPHIKWRDWTGGKSAGAEGHVYFERPN